MSELFTHSTTQKFADAVTKPPLDPFVINYLYILECSKSLRPFSCLLRSFHVYLDPFHVYKFTCVLIGLNNKQ